jgi:hypothetical protein
MQVNFCTTFLVKLVIMVLLNKVLGKILPCCKYTVKTVNKAVAVLRSSEALAGYCV